MNNVFGELGISEPLSKGLSLAGITVPTTIQKQVIPLALLGKDVIGKSATGTGKTLAYLLPIMEKIDTTIRQVQAVVLAPTHELAMQIYRQLEMLNKNAGMAVTAAPIIGSVNIQRQVESLKEKPQVIVGSSGRILELIQKKKINAQTIKIIVLDEVDRLLDDNNLESVKAVIKTTQRERQLLFFSATIAPATLDCVKQLTQEVEFIAAEGQTEVPPDITHTYLLAEQRDKIEVFRKLLASLKAPRGLVFINKSEAIEITVAKLNYHGIKAAGIFGASKQADRKKALEDFRSGRIQLLVASDLAARGLDIPDIPFIFNLELPEDPQVYLHRAGRTGRAGKSGCVISLVTRREEETLPRLGKILHISLSAQYLSRGILRESTRPSNYPPANRTKKKKE
ncbi:MAG: cshA 1 [Firmicutes bacterium]|nr:cshA 1 [Bacillota bacterium]